MFARSRDVRVGLGGYGVLEDVHDARGLKLNDSYVSERASAAQSLWSVTSAHHEWGGALVAWNLAHKRHGAFCRGYLPRLAGI